MIKKIRLFILIILLTQVEIYGQSQVEIYGQSIYAEVGFNDLGKVDYTNVDGIAYRSERTFMPQRSIEIGFKHQTSELCILSMGLSSNAYNFTNNLYVSMDSTLKDNVHIKSLFKLAYLGANLGVDYVLFDKDQWRIYTSGKLSGNILDRGIRRDRVMNADPSILPGSSTNLMLNENFEKLWFNVQFGFALSYELSSSMSVYTRYAFNQSLTSIKNDNESYDFSSHAFSVGLTFNIRKHQEDTESGSDSL